MLRKQLEERDEQASTVMQMQRNPQKVRNRNVVKVKEFIQVESNDKGEKEFEKQLVVNYVLQYLSTEDSKKRDMHAALAAVLGVELKVKSFSQLKRQMASVENQRGN